MILVTLGTQDKPFKRLLLEIQRLIDEGIIQDRVVVQAGFTTFTSSQMEIFDLIPMDDFDALMRACDLLITHGGVGSIVNGLNQNKKVIAIPRLAKYGEHVNDHQVQIIDNFDQAGYIIGLHDPNEIEQALKKVNKFKPKKYKSNRDYMVKLITDIIDQQ